MPQLDLLGFLPTGVPARRRGLVPSHSSTCSNTQNGRTHLRPLSTYAQISLLTFLFTAEKKRLFHACLHLLVALSLVHLAPEKQATDPLCCLFGLTTAQLFEPYSSACPTRGRAQFCAP